MPIKSPLEIIAKFVKALSVAARDYKFRALLFLISIAVAGGTVFYRYTEAWSWLDSLYFTIITITTVGYGDFSPVTPLGKIFTMFYLMLSVGLLVGIVSILSNHIIKQETRKTHKQLNEKLEETHKQLNEKLEDFKYKKGHKK
jgi:voltage-gated potassium channel Kch